MQLELSFNCIKYEALISEALLELGLSFISIYDDGIKATRLKPTEHLNV